VFWVRVNTEKKEEQDKKFLEIQTRSNKCTKEMQTKLMCCIVGNTEATIVSVDTLSASEYKTITDETIFGSSSEPYL
jgi:hypothetical protein